MCTYSRMEGQCDIVGEKHIEFELGRLEFKTAQSWILGRYRWAAVLV